jgi:hypothetical protein
MFCPPGAWGSCLSCRWFASLLLSALVACSSGHETPAQKLKLDLYLMATCPFASELLAGLVPVVAGLGEQAELGVHYIGTTTGEELSSIYGSGDLAAAADDLCALEQGGTDAWLSSVCGRIAAQAEPDSELARTCAQVGSPAHGSGKRCASTEQGRRLVRASFSRSAAAGIAASPTLFVDGVKYDGGRRQHFVAQAVCRAPGGRDAPYCAALPKPAPIRVTVLTDRRCQAARCDTSRIKEFVAKSIVGAQLTELDWQEARARELFDGVGASALPVVIFAPELGADVASKARLERAGMKPLHQASGYVLDLGGGWNPHQPG